MISVSGHANLSTSAGVTLTVPSGALYAQVVVEVAAVRWRDDGTAPTSAVGMPIAAGGALTYRGNLSAIQFIGQTAGATVNVSYYK